MADRLKNRNHTGKSVRKKEGEVVLDSNMVGYLYLLSSKNLTIKDYLKMKKILTNEQFQILKCIVDNNFDVGKFYVPPQVMREVLACAKMKGDDGIVKFLESLCKIKIPRTRADKVRYADIIVTLMEEYLKPDLPDFNNNGQKQSAIASEIKNGEVSFADGKVVAEGVGLYGGRPIITKNEKHLISMPIGRKNNLRSLAILEKNKKVLKNPKVVIPHKRIKTHLKSNLSTTFRINEMPKFLDM